MTEEKKITDPENTNETESADEVNTEAEDTKEAEDAKETEDTKETENTADSEEETPKKKERDLGWARKGKNKKAEEEKEKSEAELEAANEKYARLFAEFDNFRKRSEKEKSAMFGMGVKDTVDKILPIIDSFERGLATVPEDKKEDPFVIGMDKVYKQFIQILESMGVKAIEAVGKEFDPNYHNAVMHVEDENVGENIVVEEFQKGYMYRDSVIRASMVKVAN